MSTSIGIGSGVYKENDDAYRSSFQYTKFNGSSSVIERSSTLINSPTAGTVFTVSFWIHPQADSINQEFFTIKQSNIAQHIELGITNSNEVRIVTKHSSGVTCFSFQSATSISAGGGPYHILASVDRTNNYAALYLNDVLDNGTYSSTEADYTFTPTGSTRVSIGAGITFNDGWTGYYNGCISELYINTDTSIVESSNTITTANREKFYNNGKYVDLGETGSKPTGSQPIVYVPNCFTGINRGFGGSFTDVMTDITQSVSCT